MRHTLVPVVLLVIVALSSCNVLPMLSATKLLKTIGIDGQTDDNIISNTLSREHNLQNILKELHYDQSQKERLRKRNDYDISPGTNKLLDISIEDLIDSEKNYDGEGFHKEQWHNYPRQLDRLHDYLFNNIIPYKSSPEANDPDDTPDALNVYNINTATNEFLLDNRDDKNNDDTIVEAKDPILLLQLHLAKSQNKDAKTKLKNIYDPCYGSRENIDDDVLLSNSVNPAIDVKRDGTSKEDTYDLGDDSRKERKTVAKRLFSLWSRLQSLSHKGHELPHRRHIHAFYSLQPDAMPSGGFPAEIRRDVRPPGAPLRWG